ncbi:hypothetical protein DWB61_00625 [Ancylomarina euxinus]|uniref:Uncharacterized protein n=1 Tax=Ancylomarina euxinus TaxID=2283627 RepID=A0A425Y7L0_9BACT|nr:hypothetical protein [Ancylomarina euxinus]MCZ4693583.1 hypothetical protein [Ancylomarina euxinus]MUP13811.1 hypothetical protein [Ancylomarina euxinus]RRG24555.1 hypothetical protein DWB61_00625 [Ancylomarina euxinus]
MPFIKEIEKYRSLSIVGLEKNTGKTECLNYVLSRLSGSTKQIALTSIGIDGENSDLVTQTHKPEIEVHEGMIFVTSELHYQKKKVLAEILDVSSQTTSLGRLVTAKAKSSDKVMISGPASNAAIKDLISQMRNFNVDITLVDGALSRKSLGSPAVTDAMILATGAALSANIPQLVYKTNYTYDLISLKAVGDELKERLLPIQKGIWTISEEGELFDLEIESVLLIEKAKDKLFTQGNRIFVNGAITDKFLNFLRIQKQIKEIEIIVRDFTRIFASPETYYAFIKRGGRIKVLQKTKLIAVCINPVSPDGYCLNSDELKQAMEEKLKLPIYNVRELNGHLVESKCDSRIDR